MKNNAKTILVALPLTIALTVAATLTVQRIPWDTLGVLLSAARSVITPAERPPRTASPPMHARGRPDPEPVGLTGEQDPFVVVVAEPFPPQQEEADPADSPGEKLPQAALASALETAPAAYEPQGNGQPSAASAPKEGAAQASPPKPVDYVKLQENVKLVTDTLDRFNQKLLRMIAQARAEQKRQQEAEASKEGKTTVALDEKKD